MSATIPLASFARARRWLFAELRPWRARILASMLLFALAAAAGLVLPFAFGRLVDAVQAGDRSAVLPIGAVALGGLIGAAVVSAGAAVLLTFSLEVILAGVRSRVTAAALGLPGDIADAVPAGELTSRGSDDVDALREAISGPIPTLASSAAAVGMTLMGLLALHPGFLAAIVVVIPVHVLAVRAYLRRAPRLYEQERTIVARRSRGLYEALQGREAIRAYGSMGGVRERAVRRSWAVVRAAMSIRVVQSRFFLRLGFAEMLGTVTLLLVGFALVAAQLVTVGQATTALLVLLALFAPMNGLLLVIDDLLAASAALRRVVGVVDAAEHEYRVERSGGIAACPGPRSVAGPSAAIALERVSVELGGRRVLRDVSIRVPAGQVVALVGASGAGKTTLARVLAGDLAVSAGIVRVHDTDPVLTNASGIARLVTVVDQYPHVFGVTLAENLLLADPRATDETILAAAGRDGWGTGLDTDLGATDIDSELRQRLAVGRALLGKSPVVIFDEATAGSDGVGAQELDGLIRAACVGRTVIMIAHRLSQAEKCDRVIVMERGGIVEDGAPAELRSAGGTYARLWEAWAAGGNRGATA